VLPTAMLTYKTLTMLVYRCSSFT